MKYRFFGNFSEVHGTKLTLLGQSIEMTDEEFVDSGDVFLLPSAEFDSFFDAATVKAFATPANRGENPDVAAKIARAHERAIQLRAELKAAHKEQE